MKKSPCVYCTESGCGKHSECEKYMQYWQERRDATNRKHKDAVLNDYVTRAIAKVKSGRYSSTKKYRPK